MVGGGRVRWWGEGEVVGGGRGKVVRWGGRGEVVV